MPIDFEHLMSLRIRGERVTYTDRDPLLYALGIGFGRDAAERDELPYLVEHRGLRIVPTFASVLTPNTVLQDCGWNADRVIPGEEQAILDRPLDESGSLLVDSDVVAVFDRGADAGAVIVVESRGRRERDGQAMFTVRRTWLARADGGFGGPRGDASAGHRLPARSPDMVHHLATRADQALLFRLSGDRNPIHVDPAVARQHGLAGPVLHGLCIHGMACYAILKVICEYDHTLIRSLTAGFTGPVYPGETLVAELWQDANIVSVRLRVLERDKIVLDQGRCVLAT